MNHSPRMLFGTSEFMHGDTGYGGAWFWTSGIVHLLLLAALIVALFFLVRALLRRFPAPAPSNPALTELEVRYARGELSREDYAQRRADLINPALLAVRTSTPTPPTT